MSARHLFAAGALAVGFSFAGWQAEAGPLAVNTGWTYDQIDAAGVDSDNSPWTFTLTAPGFFRLTDAFAEDDTFSVTDGVTTWFSAVVGPQASIAPIGDPGGDFAWTSGFYSVLEIALPPGTYSFTIQGDGAGGVPAGLYVRADQMVDAVPAPAALSLLLLGLAGLAVARRRA